MSNQKPIKKSSTDEKKSSAKREQPNSVVPNSLLFDNPLFKYLLDAKKEDVLQANDSSRVFKTKSKGLNPENFAAYPNSPTAQRYLKAYELFSNGWLLLQIYGKNTVKTEEDCDHLQRAFHCYSFGHISEQHLFSQFRPPYNFSKLIKEYLKIRPNDILSEFCFVANTTHPSFKFMNIIPGMKIDIQKNQTDFEYQKHALITREKLIHKIESLKSSENDKLMLFYLNYANAATYVTTKQRRRALDSFEKCRENDPSDPSGIYGVAFQYMESDPEKAIRLFKEYIKMAPDCDKQYPNAHYMLSSVYMLLGNMQEAFRYSHMGEEAETKRLDFLEPVDLPQKTIKKLISSMVQTDRRSILSQ